VPKTITLSSAFAFVEPAVKDLHRIARRFHRFCHVKPPHKCASPDSPQTASYLMRTAMLSRIRRTWIAKTIAVFVTSCSIFALDEPFRIWSPAKGLTKVNLLRDALNRIIHATEFKVGFEKLPGAATKIESGAVGVIYLATRTDQRDEALVDVFALASCFFHKVLPELNLPDKPSTPEAVH
jgi:hypothetical protein